MEVHSGVDKADHWESVSQAQAALPELRSQARRNNCHQREETLSANDMLQKWYGTEHEPQLTEDAREMLTELEPLPPGARSSTSGSSSYSACTTSPRFRRRLSARYRASSSTRSSRRDCDNYGICDLQLVERSTLRTTQTTRR